MKKKFSLRNFFTFIFLVLYCENSNAIPRCEQFYNEIYNDPLKMDVIRDYTEKQKSIDLQGLGA